MLATAIAALVVLAPVSPEVDAPTEATPAEAATTKATPGEAATGEAATTEAATGEAATGEAETGEAASGETATVEPVEPTIVEPATSTSSPMPTRADPSVTAPAPRPAIASATSAKRTDPAREHAVESFTARRGFRMATAGTAVAAAGVAWLGVAGWMLSNDDPRLGLSLAFTINGAVATTVGLGLAIGGAPRSRHPATWLAAKSSRRARMEAASIHFEPHAPTSAAERNVVARGLKLRNYGFMTLTAGVGLVAFGTGMQFAYGGDSLALKIVVPAVSVPFVIAGSVLLAVGGRRVHSPQRFVTSGRVTSRRPRVPAPRARARAGLGCEIVRGPP